MASGLETAGLVKLTFEMGISLMRVGTSLAGWWALLREMGTLSRSG